MAKAPSPQNENEMIRSQRFLAKEGWSRGHSFTFIRACSVAHSHFKLSTTMVSERKITVSQDCEIVPTTDDADWLQPNEPIADQALDFDSVFLRILKPTDTSEPQCADEARSCWSNILPPSANGQIRTDSTEPIRRAMADTRDLASIPPPTILLGSRRRSPNLSPAKAVPLQ